jgi:PIN domain nuclease of toxin-antitoxin system
MKVLLDTHVLIWWSLDSVKLTKKIYELLTDPDNTLVVSIASIWEMQVKVQLGKLDLDKKVSELITHQQQVNNLEVLPIDPAHVYALESLPHEHRDPFDRIIIAQSIVEAIPLLSADKVFDRYPVERIW